MFLSLLLLWRQLLHARGRVEDWAQEVDDVGVLLTVLVERFEQISLVVTTEKAFDLVDRAFWKLGHELFPVAVFDLQESDQVVCLEEHQADEASV